MAITGSTPERSWRPPGPNFVFILADDMRADDLKYMPKTRALLGNNGMSFKNAFVSTPLCCPARATIMRGQYPQNTGVWANKNSFHAGWQGYQEHGNEQDNVATRLHDAGYRTALLGKYLNGYRGHTVPPGWDYWFAKYNRHYFDYDVNDNGTITQYGTADRDYSTDVLSRKTRQFIDASVASGRPFFAYVAPTAPHGLSVSPPEPAPRDRHTFDGESAPRLPSFNEEDVSDKPPSIQQLPSLSAEEIARIDAWHQGRAESLQALDDLVERVVNKLSGVEELDNTYILFTSDHGWHHGEHRLPRAKSQPYEEDVHIPLLVRGPGVQAGSTTDELVLNTDYFPAIMDLSGTATPNYVDGRSLRPLLEGNATTWRSAILLEKGRTDRIQWQAIRTSGRKYIEYASGFKELYDMSTDPYEMNNSYDASSPPTDLATRLAALKNCAGMACRQAEDGP